MHTYTYIYKKVDEYKLFKIGIVDTGTVLNKNGTANVLIIF